MLKLLAVIASLAQVAEPAPGASSPSVAPGPVEPDAPPPAPSLPPSDAPAVEAAPVRSAEAEATAPSQFVKGELSMYLGSDRLVVKNNRIGVSAGLDSFGQTYYLLVEPMVDLRFLDAKLGVGLGVPLRLELVNFQGSDPNQWTKNLGRLRSEDYSAVHDFGRTLKYVTYGRKEDTLYVSAGQRYASSLGHGALMRRYAPNTDILYPRASAQVDAYNDYGGFELFTNDLLEWNTLGGLAFVKPLSLLGASSAMAKSFSVGVTGAADRTAPWELQTAGGVRQTDPKTGRLLASTRGVALFGVDAEFKLLKTEGADVKPYVDYSMMVGGDGGFTVGVLGRFNVGAKTINAFRVVAELRALGSHYQPSYFDTFYEVERYTYREQLPRVDPNVASYVTKASWVLNQGLGQRLGYYLEASWGIPGNVGVTLAFEGVNTAPEKNLIAHLELPVLDFLQVFGSVYKRGLGSLADLATLDEKTILYAGARLKILPFLFVNGRAYKTFRMNPDLQRYDNQFGFSIDVEVGYEFGKKRVAPPPQERPDAPTPAEGSAGSDSTGR